MMTPSSKKHWMVDVLKYSGPPRATFSHGTPAAEVWTTARMVSGLSMDALAQKVAAHFKLAVADLAAADRRILKLVPETLARRYGVFPVRQDDRHLHVATSEPSNLAAEQAIAFASSRTTVFQVAPPQAIENAIADGYSTHRYSSIPMTDSLRIAIQEEPPAAPAANIGVSGLQLAKSPFDNAVPDVWDTAEPNAIAEVPNKPNILIVDDDTITRRLAWSILAKHGYGVEEACDGFAALERVDSGSPPALIVLDLDMPKLGGREVLVKLKSSRATAKIPVIVLTGSGTDAAEADLMEEGADDYIRKPIEPSRFTARIRAALRRASW